MKILSLGLSNFRQHRDSRFEFSEGITGIIGQNGCGKTTIVEAIAFALYGSRAIRGKVDDLVSRGARKDEILSVSLHFEHDGGTYRVERDVGDASLFVGGAAQ